MKKRIIFTFAVLLFLPSISLAQAWDWVTDEKSMQAFSEQYLDLTDGQLGEMLKYLEKTIKIKNEQQAIAEKVRFIHMVRDSLFKSLQDVRGIDNSLNEQLIYTVFGQVEAYYTHISCLSNKNEDFKQVWIDYDNLVVSHTKSLLKFTEMAVKGSDEQNLLDKEQRLLLLSYVLYEMKNLREYSKSTYNKLIAGDAQMRYSIDFLYQQAEELKTK